MPDYRTIRELDEATAVESTESYLVRGEDLRRWSEEMRQLRVAAESEREQCAEIAEHYLGQLFHGHGATGDQVVMEIIEAIRGRGENR